jgi:hypothetical protein
LPNNNDGLKRKMSFVTDNRQSGDFWMHQGFALAAEPRGHLQASHRPQRLNGRLITAF